MKWVCQDLDVSQDSAYGTYTEVYDVSTDQFTIW